MANDNDGEETIAIGMTGQFVTLTNGALQDIQIKLWEGGEDGADWKTTHAAAAFKSEPESTGRLRLTYKPLARDAKAIRGLQLRANRTQARRRPDSARREDISDRQGCCVVG